MAGVHGILVSKMVVGRIKRIPTERGGRIAVGEQNGHMVMLKQWGLGADRGRTARRSPTVCNGRLLLEEKTVPGRCRVLGVAHIDDLAIADFLPHGLLPVQRVVLGGKRTNRRQRGGSGP